MKTDAQMLELPTMSGAGKIRGRFFIPENAQIPCPLVVMLSGDSPKGTKSPSWTKFPPILARKGFASFLFDFEGLGYSDGDRYELTLTKAIGNFKSAFASAIEDSRIDSSRIGILGSSFGATVLLLSPEAANKAKAIGLKSPAAFLPDAFINEAGVSSLDELLTKGRSEAMGYNISIITDSLRYNVFTVCQQINSPILITHGSADKIVPIQHSKFLLSVLPKETKLEIFYGVGHTYSEIGAWERMATLFADWFASKL